MAKKKSDRPSRVNICFDQILYDLDFMSNEYAGIILKMIVWYSAGTKECKDQIEHMEKYINTLPDKGWLTSLYKRLFDRIDDDFSTYAEICEKRRQAIEKRWRERDASIQENTNEYKSKQMNTSVYLTNTNTNTNISNEINNIEEEEEDMRAREEKSSEALRLDTFCDIWNEAIIRAKRKRDEVPMKPVSCADLPSDAGERIAKALTDIEGWLDEKTLERVFKACPVSRDASRTDIAKWYMLMAMNRLATVSMKSRDSSFGSFNWFINYPRRIKKLFDEDIQ